MNNKKILISLLLVILVALSVSSVSAENATDALAAADADDAVAVDADAEVVAATFQPATNDSTGIQNAIDNAAVGDIVDLSNWTTYDIADKTISVAKDNLTIQGNGKTTITGYGSGNGFFDITAKYVVISGINFVDTNPKNNLTYGGSVNGWGVNFNGGANGVVQDCTFQDFNQAVVVNSADYITIKNNKFYGGYATKLINDPTVNKEQGSKTISVGGSFFTTIVNNTFDGPVLDAISIAKASGDARIYNNTIIDAAYAIFFGGASTEGTYIEGNNFTHCGIYEIDGRYYTGFPVISVEKASDSISISNNYFTAVNDNKLIAAEQGNAAHGYPSTLGNINVTGNTVVAANDTIVGSSVTLLHINCRNSQLNPFAAIDVTGNTLFQGVRAVVVWSTEWGTEDAYNKKTGEDISNVIIPKADLVPTEIVIENIAADGTVTGKLVDFAGTGINAVNITAVVNGTTQNITTGKNGAFTIAGIPENDVAVAFNGTTTYAASSLDVALPKTIILTPVATEMTATGATIYAGNSGTVVVTLKQNGEAYANQTVTVYVDGASAGVFTTDANGTVSIAKKLAAAGTSSVVAYYAGDNNNKASMATAKITAKINPTALTAAKATFKVNKAKKVTVTLKSNGKAVANKKITITVNGKTFSGKTNSAGKATITVKVAKKGSLTATVKFAGDSAYKAVTKKVKYTIKK